MRTKKIVQVILWTIAAISILFTLLSVISVEYRKGASIQLPASCREWSLTNGLSATCRSDIKNMKKAPVIEAPICYDNDKYVKCEALANDILRSKQAVVGFSLTSLVFASFGIAMTRRINKKLSSTSS